MQQLNNRKIIPGFIFISWLQYPYITALGHIKEDECGLVAISEPIQLISVVQSDLLLDVILSKD